MATSPLKNANDAVDFEIRIDGDKTSDAIDVLSIRTRTAMNAIPEALVIVADGDIGTQEFPITDGGDFVPGKEIEIKATYGEAEFATIFKGIIIGTRLRLDARAQMRLEVTCRDKAFKLDMAARHALFTDKTDSDVISSIVKGAGLNASVDATSVTHAQLLQHNVTDFEFILARAEANGLVVAIAEGTVAVQAPSTSATGIGVTLGEDIVAFDCEIDARRQFASYKATGWEPETQKIVEGSGKKPPAGKIGNQTASKLAGVGSADWTQTTSADLEKAALDDIASARASRAELARLRGQVTFQGNADIRLNKTLEVAGVGDRFSGTGLVCSVVHRIESGNWITEAGLGLPPPGPGRHAGAADPFGTGGMVGGLQVGKVKKIDQDPDSAFRIQVTLPLVGDDAQVWARWSSPYASEKFGMQIMPEIDDEVIVGFAGGDPSYPLVLGSLYSSKRAPPETPDEANTYKVLLTKSQLRLEFNDEDKVVTISTPASNKLTLSDDDKKIEIEDQHGNKITLDDSGITLDSPKDITVKAGGNVDVSATGDISLSATGDLSASGLNVSASADAKFSASGNAGGELTSAANLTIRGALVSIN